MLSLTLHADMHVPALSWREEGTKAILIIPGMMSQE